MRGFIALTSVLIISAVLLLIVVGSSAPAFYARIDQISSEIKDESRLLAGSCASLIGLKRLHDPTYRGDETLAVGEGTCLVGPLELKNGTASVVLSATYRDALTRLMVVEGDDGVVVSEREIPN